MNRIIVAFLMWVLAILAGPAHAVHQPLVLMHTSTVSRQFDVPTPEHIVERSGGKTSHSTAQRIIKAVILESKSASVDPSKIFRIIETESHYIVNAVSFAGAKGLMQVLPSAHPEKVKGKNLFDITTNVRIGIQIYKEIRKRKGLSEKDALQAYAGAPAGSRYTKKVRSVNWSYNKLSKHLKGAVPESYNERRFFASLGLGRVGTPLQSPHQFILAMAALNKRY